MNQWNHTDGLVAVAGATGNVGSEVVRALSAAGRPVRAFVRSAEDDVPEAAETVVLDLTDPDAVVAGLSGAEAAFVLPGFPAVGEALTRSAADGLERVALLSSPAADLDRSNAVAAYMADSEAAVRAAGVPWTIVRSCMFASNALQWVDQLRTGDEIHGAFPEVRAAVIHSADIGACVASVLTSDGHAGHTYRISGPEATTQAERVAVLGEVLGRPLRFTGLSDDEARAEMEGSMPTQYVDAFFDFYATGTLDEALVVDTVQRLSGEPPRTFRTWAEDHADRFR